MARNAENPRLRNYTIKELEEIAERASAAHKAVNGVISKMKKRKLDVLQDVDGTAMMERGFEQIGDFVVSCEKKLKPF